VLPTTMKRNMTFSKWCCIYSVT